MQTKKMYERINWYKKEYVHNQYARIIPDFKDYEKISRKKMLEEIYDLYRDYNVILDICTTRELKFLEMLLYSKCDEKELLSDKYQWERKTLRDKFLVQDELDTVFIPDEIMNRVREAIQHVDWKVSKKMDDLNEILVGYCKIQGSALLLSVCAIVSSMTGIEEDVIHEHALHNKLFQYYVLVYQRNFESIGNDLFVTLYWDYYSIEDELEEERKNQGLAGALPMDLKKLQTFFYHDFDIHNKKVQKFLTEIKKLPFFWTSALDIIRQYAMLNIDRTSLKESFQNVPSLKNYDLTEFFQVLDEAMDEMPSGALNGFTPNQAKELKIEDEIMKYDKAKRYVKQQNACLSQEDAALFYKIYFALLEFTNLKYQVNPKLKIYNQEGINPYELKDVIEKFWENKEDIVSDFCKVNPYKFHEDELEICSDFKKGFRDVLIVVRFEPEYTAVMSKDKTYMIKGINDNIDNILSYQDLPEPLITSIIPFKNVLVYDGVFLEFSIKMGNDFSKMIEEEYSKSMKYYHL